MRSGQGEILIREGEPVLTKRKFVKNIKILVGGYRSLDPGIQISRSGDTDLSIPGIQISRSREQISHPVHGAIPIGQPRALGRGHRSLDRARWWPSLARGLIRLHWGAFGAVPPRLQLPGEQAAARPPRPSCSRGGDGGRWPRERLQQGCRGLATVTVRAPWGSPRSPRPPG